MRIIPAIDIIQGECVRLAQGDYGTKKIYSSNPVEQARRFEKAGLKFIHLVDLDGAKQSKPANLHVLSEICAHTSLMVDFGGGIKTEDSLIAALEAGAVQVTIGSLASSDPKRVSGWILKYGPEKIIIGTDVKIGIIQTHGWQKSSRWELGLFLKYYLDAGAKYFVCTDIAKDGMMEGSSKDLYSKLINEFDDLSLIASGGISSLEELSDLRDLGLDGAIIGKSIYEGRISLEELSSFVNG